MVPAVITGCGPGLIDEMNGVVLSVLYTVGDTMRYRRPMRLFPRYDTIYDALVFNFWWIGLMDLYPGCPIIGSVVEGRGGNL